MLKPICVAALLGVVAYSTTNYETLPAMASTLAKASLRAPQTLAAQNSAGALDPTFGNGGRVVTALGGRPVDVALQSDGKIVVAADVGHFAVVRFLSNGATDLSFGRNGSVTTAFTNFFDTPSAVTIQSNGRILVVGAANGSSGGSRLFALARYDSNGALDPSFGNGGKVTTNVAGANLPFAEVVSLQPDGKIVVGGVSIPGHGQPQQSLIVRYNANGSLDATFGQNGVVLGNIVGAVAVIALQSDGKIRLTGSRVVRLLPNGGIDTSIVGGTIIAVAHTGTTAFAFDGRILAATTRRNRNDIDFFAVRFHPDGSIDPTFRSFLLDFGPIEGPDALANVPNALGIMSNGKLVVTGDSGAAAFTSVFGLARFNTDGSLDSTFGSGGKTTTAFSDNSSPRALVLSADGSKIVVVGQTFRNGSSTTNLVLARYLAQ